MVVTVIFAAITLAAVVFLLRFLVAICGPEGKPPHIVRLARVAPERGDPAGGWEQRGDAGLSLERGTFARHRVVPFHARRGEHPPNKVRTGIAAGRTGKSTR